LDSNSTIVLTALLFWTIVFGIFPDIILKTVDHSYFIVSSNSFNDFDSFEFNSDLVNSDSEILISEHTDDFDIVYEFENSNNIDNSCDSINYNISEVESKNKIINTFFVNFFYNFIKYYFL
jgi:hypothetical protein